MTQLTFHDPRRKTASLSFVAFERPIEVDPDSAGDESGLLMYGCEYQVDVLYAP